MVSPSQHRTSLLAVLVAVPLGMASPESACGETVDRVVAVVEEHAVTWTDLQWLIAYRGFRVPEEEEQRDALYAEVIDQLIHQFVIERETARTPFIDVTPAEVEQFIDSYRDRFNSREAFEEWLSDQGMAEHDLQRLVDRQITVNKFIQLRFEPFAIVLPPEIEEYYREEFLPQLEEEQSPIPPLSLVEETIRQILLLRKTNEQLETWIDSARSRARIEKRDLSGEAGSPNIPVSLKGGLGLINNPFSSSPSSYR